MIDMEFEMRSSNHLLAWAHRVLPSMVPAILISIGYVDPGKWAATIEGGVHFGFDLVLLMFTFNLAAILCQYLAARVGAITGKDLAAICNEEYDRYICILLGIQVEFSMVALDITMILGIAHGLNLLLGLDLFTCVFLTAIDAVFFPLFASLMNSKTKFSCLVMACFVLLAYAFGVLLNQPEVSISANGMPTKLSGESAFALMSLLGASIMPQNFYLHSALVKIGGQRENSLEDQCFSHFVSTLLVFSCINLVTYGLMNSAANVFYSTFQEVLEQVLRSPIALFLYLMVLLCSSQVSALTWNIGGEVILHNFFGLDIPSWLHRATIRIFAIIPATYCVWSSGAEGTYRLLVFIQVIVALLLPLSVIPLFRIASSRALMGIHKISQFVEFLAMVTPIGMLVFVIIFVVEMIFGNSEWAGNLRWYIGGSSSVPFTVLLITASASLGMMLWLAVTPLKSASSQLDNQLMSWELQNAIPGPSRKKEVSDVNDIKCFSEENILTEASPQLGEYLESHSSLCADNFGVDSPEIESDEERHLTTIEENQPSLPLPRPSIPHDEEPSLKSSLSSVSIAAGSENPDGASLDKAMKIEVIEPSEKILKADLQKKKDDCETETWEPEESIKMAPGPGNSSSLTSDGPGSFRSLSGKSDDGGNGAGSLSRLAGLGRAARRQLAAILDEFWGQLYDFHGQATQEAKAKRLDMLLGHDIKTGSSAVKMDTSGLESSGYFPVSDSLISSNLIDSSEQQRMPCSLDSPYGVQRGSSLWSNRMNMDTYVQNSNRNVFDSGERRYSSLRLPPSSDAWDKQPTTVHGYQIASYLSPIAAGRSSDCYNGLELPVSKSLSLGPTNYKDSNAFTLGQQLQNGLSPLQSSSYQNIAGSRNMMLSERLYYENFSPNPSHTVGQPVNTKKYHSLPDISGVSVAQRDLTSNKNNQWDNSIGLHTSFSKTSYETSPYRHSGLRSGAPLTFDELSPSGKYREALSMQLTSSSDTASLWSMQPFEHFNAAEKVRPVGSGIETRSSSLSKGSGCGSIVDPEAMLLQSFRQCILKLLKLEGSDWLFKQNDGADEDLIDRVAAREKFLSDVENKEMTRFGDAPYSSERRSGSVMRTDECYSANLFVSSIPHCGDDCIWRADLIISFGVWCIHRILDLSLMESRPELWGKYTYVLNRLQGIIDLAFSKPRTPMCPCFCLEISGPNFQQALALSGSNGSLPPKPGRGKCTNAATLLDIIKDVEIAISSRKGRTGTAAGDVAFPKGKENLASVLKRYKRRLSNKPTGTLESAGSRKIPPAVYGS